MFKLIFWNIDRKPLLEEVHSLAYEHNADFIILAEDPISSSERLLSLNKSAVKYHTNQTSCERIQIFCSFDDSYITPLIESKYFTLREINLPLYEPFFLFAIHWKSLLWRSEHSQMLSLTQIAQLIREEETKKGHRRTIAVGDFNTDPFNIGMTASTGMHAVMCRQTALRMKREISPFGDFPFFYNPTWSVFGDDQVSPPGTYYRSSSGEHCQFWHVFDQVLIRPDLLPILPFKSLQIPIKAGKTHLLCSKGYPVISDHLPVVFKFEIPQIIRS